MARMAKTLARMKSNPRADWRIEHFEPLALSVGAHVRKPGGSHVIFEHPGVVEVLSVPARRPIKPVYVRRFVAWIEAVERENAKAANDQS